MIRSILRRISQQEIVVFSDKCLVSPGIRCISFIKVFIFSATLVITLMQWLFVSVTNKFPLLSNAIEFEKLNFELNGCPST